MILNHSEYIIECHLNGRSALQKLEALSNKESRTLFVLAGGKKLVGTITDGDIRRGLLAGREISEGIDSFMNRDFKFILEGEVKTEVIRHFKGINIQLLPILTPEKELLKILDLKNARSVIPASALIMAGGKGERLRPLTDTMPKPMLNIGGKPILEHTIDRLISFGITKIFISVNYLKEKIMDYFGNGSMKGVEIVYIVESAPLGTIGAMSLIEEIQHEDILVLNSDILTDIDLEDFFLFYKEHGAAMAVASIPYNVNVPYAVLETNDHVIQAFKEKPSFTYYSNAGIYFLNSVLKDRIVKDKFFNATDLMDELIGSGKKLVHYPVRGYWLDIGRYQDYIKGQEDIKHLRL
jgi:dTDP-glucose pyrophosphorylase